MGNLQEYACGKFRNGFSPQQKPGAAVATLASSKILLQKMQGLCPAPVSRIVPVAITALALCICTLAGGVAYAMCYLQPDRRQQCCLKTSALHCSPVEAQLISRVYLHIGSFSLCTSQRKGATVSPAHNSYYHCPPHFQHQPLSPSRPELFLPKSYTSQAVTKQPQLPTKGGSEQRGCLESTQLAQVQARSLTRTSSSCVPLHLPYRERQREQ